MTRCEDVQPRLSELADGALDGAQAAAVRAHLAACDACRGVAADLDRLRDAAAALGPVTPPDHVWLAVAGQMRLDEPRAEPATAAPGSLRQWLGLAAALVLITIGLYAVSRLTSPGPETSPGNAGALTSVEALNEELTLALDHYENAIGILKLQVATGDGSLDADVAATIDRNIAVIDQAIAESRAALSDDPTSQPARASLLEALSQKVNVLQATVLLMNEMRQGDSAGAAEAAGSGGTKSS